MASTFVGSVFNPSLVIRCSKYVICDWSNFLISDHISKISDCLFICSSIVLDHIIMSSISFLFCLSCL